MKVMIKKLSFGHANEVFMKFFHVKESYSERNYLVFLSCTINTHTQSDTSYSMNRTPL